MSLCIPNSNSLALQLPGGRNGLECGISIAHHVSLRKNISKLKLTVFMDFNATDTHPNIRYERTLLLTNLFNTFLFTNKNQY